MVRFCCFPLLMITALTLSACGRVGQADLPRTPDVGIAPDAGGPTDPIDPVADVVSGSDVVVAPDATPDGVSDVVVEPDTAADTTADTATNTDAFVPDPNGECVYRRYVGTCIIRNVRPVEADQNSCTNQPLQILFDYIPPNEQVPDRYLYPEVSDEDQRLLILDGKNPPASCSELFRVTQEYACTRAELESGPCAPVTFTFRDGGFIDRCEEDCF